MANRLIITRNEDKIITALYKDNDMIEVSVDKLNKSIISNIYIGRVQTIVNNISSAFIDVGIGTMCYYPLNDNTNPIYIKQSHENKLTVGDEILVQVVQEALKTKAPSLSSNISIQGKYAVLTHNKAFIGVSNKIEDLELRNALKELATKYLTDEYGFIIRTNAQYTDIDTIETELQQLILRFSTIKEICKYRKCFQVIDKAPENYLTSIRNCNLKELLEVLVEDSEIYEDIKDFLGNSQPEDVNKLIKYESKLQPLIKKFNIESKLEKAVQEKVWLSSGAYIVIQPTEAFYVIDVNTGKFSGKKSVEETFLKINLEAAKEIAKQIRLRNLSGIILIDFIDMQLEENKNKLLQALATEVASDSIKTTVVGMTKLNIVEVTRKKIKPSLYEQIL